MNPEKLSVVLDLHEQWLNNQPGGKRAILTGANLAGADLAEANLAGADLTEANLAEANLAGANLAGADLTEANLAGADLTEANLAEANLIRASLRGAELRGADLDFSSGIPFHCGGTDFIGDDRLFAQMVYSLTRGDWSQCSGGVQESVEHIRKMAVTDLFCEYRDDVEPIRPASE